MKTDPALQSAIDNPQSAIDISIVVPVFEEEESLPELAQQIREVCQTAGFSFEVRFVDDG